MCEDPGEAGEHPRGAAGPLPGDRQGQPSGAHRGDEGLGQPCPTESGARPHHLLHRLQEEPLLHGE